MKQVTTILILLVSISAFSQGPWTQEKGKFYTQLSFTAIPNYDSLFGNPDYNTERKTTDNTLQAYAEYGLSDKTSIILNLPIKLIKTSDLSNPISGNPAITNESSEKALGNIELSLRHNFYNKKWLLSGQLSVESNTSTFDGSSGIRTGYDAWSFKPLFLVGKGSKNSYLQMFVGANLKTNKYSSSAKFGGEYGRKITKRIWLVGFLDIEKSFENGDIILPASNLATGLYVNNQEYGVAGIKTIGEFSDNFGITASLPAAFFGNNVAKQVALSVGIYKKF
jgi:hypothetical protein